MTDSVKKIFLYLFLSLLIFSCSTAPDKAPGNSEPLYMARPKILLESPRTFLPLSLVWEDVKGARAYEIQLSEELNFSCSIQNWTLRESSFDLDEMDCPVKYLRIRSRFTDGTSRWSEVLEIKKEENEIHLQWLR